MFKFLDPSGCTYCAGKVFVYNLPGREEKWAITAHPKPAQPDGVACGSGRLHLMKHLDVFYAPRNSWPWWAHGVGLIGEDDEKAAYAAVRLRRIIAPVFWRALRPPFNWGRGANLRGINLWGANLEDANLEDANLQGVNLRGANLQGANLQGINLEGADLRGVDLRCANLEGANLEGVNLKCANLEGANLRVTNLWDANLEGVFLKGANLEGANLRGANLEDAIGYEQRTD